MKNYMTLLRILPIATLIGFIASCSRNDDGYPRDQGEVDSSSLPVIEFSASSTMVFAEETVQFSNTSTNDPFLFTWTFEGGSPTTSTEENPTVTYLAQGTFSVTLRARNDFGVSETIKEGLITVEAPPIPYVVDYPFDGDLTDVGSVGADAVSNYGNPQFGEDRKGNATGAYQATGIADEFLTTPGLKGIEGTAARTVMAWVKIPSESVNLRNTIVSWGVNDAEKMFNVMVHQGRIRIEAGASNLRSAENFLADNAWHHIAVSYDPADGEFLKDVRLYIDGKAAVNEPDAGASFNSEIRLINTVLDEDMYIGQAIYSANHRFNGFIDELRIIDRALLPGEISAAALE